MGIAANKAMKNSQYGFSVAKSPRKKCVYDYTIILNLSTTVLEINVHRRTSEVYAKSNHLSIGSGAQLARRRGEGLVAMSAVTAHAHGEAGCR